MKNDKHLYLISVATIFLLVLIAAVFTSFAQEDKSDASTLTVSGAWVRPADEMSAAYFEITNNGDRNDQLIAVQSDFAMAEIHETHMENDVMRMRQIESIEVPAGESVILKPRSYHVMLMQLAQPLIEGEQVSLTLIFASGIEIPITAWVSHTPIPESIEADDLTQHALDAVENEIYVGQVINPPIQVQDFSAPASNKNLTRLSDTNGKWRVIFFGYMHCPDFCPLTLVEYKDAKVYLDDLADDVTFMFISVDSARDTPEELRDYLARFDPDFVGFSPDDTTLSRIQPDYDFYYERRLDAGSQAIYTIDHSTRSYLLDPDGILRASFAYNIHPRKLADALTWYINND